MCGRFYIPEKEMDDFAKLVSEVERHLIKNTVRYSPVIPFPLSHLTVEKERFTR